MRPLSEAQEHIVSGFVVNTFSWTKVPTLIRTLTLTLALILASTLTQALECLREPTWSFIHLIAAVIIGLALLGLASAVARDRRELRFVEALIAGRQRDSRRRRARRALARGSRSTFSARASKARGTVRNLVMSRTTKSVPGPSSLPAPGQTERVERQRGEAAAATAAAAAAAAAARGQAFAVETTTVSTSAPTI